MGVSYNVALLSASVLGFRHGFDHDHIAAISDIAGISGSRYRAIRLGMIYALGHAVTVIALGLAATLFGISLPPHIDRLAEILVGVTLIVLAAVVITRKLLNLEEHRSQSQIHLGAEGIRWIIWQTRRWWNPALPPREQLTWSYNWESTFVLGIIHGVGAETPSQLLIFLLVANLGSIGMNVLVLIAFVTGLFVMNTLMTASAAGLFSSGAQYPRLRRLLFGCAAVYSLAVGIVLVAGSSSMFLATWR